MSLRVERFSLKTTLGTSVKHQQIDLRGAKFVQQHE
jgi:hypothetical protein